MWCGKYTACPMLLNGMLDFIAEAQVFIMQREDLWMIVDDIYKLALLFTCHFYCSPHIKLERQAIYFCLEVKIF